MVDAVVIGSGPNGLVAAARLARAGWSVRVLERNAVAGGAVASAEVTAPGYVHDLYSAFYGLLHAAPTFTALGLDRRVEWASFDTPVASLVAPQSAAIAHRDLEDTVAGLAAIDKDDAEAYRDLYGWWLRSGQKLFEVTLSTLPSVAPTLRFAASAGPLAHLETTKMMLAPIEAVARRWFRSEQAITLLSAGVIHSDLAVDSVASAFPAMALALVGQQHNMPVPVGGAGVLAAALVKVVTDAGGAVTTGSAVERVIVERGRAVAVVTSEGETVHARRAVVADTSPVRLFRDLVGEELLPEQYLSGLHAYRYGSGIFKVDVALRGRVPWLAEGLDQVGVIHLTGDIETMARSAFETRRGLLPAAPLLVIGQQTVADPSRAPAGGSTLWIETHVPGVPRDDAAGELAGGPWRPALRDAFLDRVLQCIEAHAPGFRSRIVGTAVRTPVDLEAENPNLVAGDLGAGSIAFDQLLVFRPVAGWFRYATPVKGLYLCSASAHPGGGVHGMVGWNCAGRVLRRGVGLLSRP